MAPPPHTQQQKTNHRKRRRRPDLSSRLAEYGLDIAAEDLPTRLPATLIPQYYAAWQQTYALFGTSLASQRGGIHPWTGQSLLPTTEQSTNDTTAAIHHQPSAGNALETVLQRVHQATTTSTANTTESIETTEETTTTQQQQQSIQKWQDSITTWLTALQRQLKEHAEAPVVLMTHFWDILIKKKNNNNSTTTTKSLQRRRTATHLMGRLCQKSAACRHWLLSADDTPRRLGQWLDVVVLTNYSNGPTTGGDHQGLLLQQQYRSWQRETYQLLSNLHDQHVELYPRLAVAVLRLQQAWNTTTGLLSNGWDGGGTTTSSAEHNATAADLRHWRDLAVTKWSRQETVVRKVMQRIEACLDIIVPRMAAATDSSEPAIVDKTTTTAARVEHQPKDDEDDEDFDWEEGFEDEDEGEGEEGHDIDAAPPPPAAAAETTTIPEESYAEAVDRTLAVLQATMPAGGLEISFDSTGGGTAAAPLSNTTTPAMQHARTQLAQCVQLLQDRHIPRLTRWIDALTRADNLALATNGSGSLVQVSGQARQERRRVLQAGLALKAEVSTVLARAQRVVVPPPLATAVSSPAATAPPAPRSIAVRQPHHTTTRLGQTLRRRPTTTAAVRKRSNKIRITYAR